MKNASPVLLALSFALFPACATPKNYKHNTLPKSEGVMVTTTAASETDALEGCKREATEYCGKDHAFVVVSGPDSRYQGPDKGGSTGVASQVVSGLFGAKRDTSEDYRAQMVFKCQ
jgi:hypothetical protein